MKGVILTEEGLIMSKFVQSADIAWNFLGENIIAFNLDGDKQFHDMNPTAALIFKQLQTPKEKSELIDSMIAEFDVDPVTASSDLEFLIGEMRAKGLITEA